MSDGDTDAARAKESADAERVEADDRTGTDLPPKWLLAVVLVSGVVVPGVTHYVLNEAGFGLAADLVWVGGYVGTAVLVWWGWLSRLDIVGPGS